MKHILFTNVGHVTIGDVRMYAHAVLLDQFDNSFGHGEPRIQCKARGFGTDPAWPVFDIFVESIEYTLQDAQSNAVIIGDSGKMRPLCSGAFLQLKGGPKLGLIVEDQDRPLDITEHDEIGGVWEVLTDKVREYWKAPNMPSLAWHEARGLRRPVGFPGRR